MNRFVVLTLVARALLAIGFSTAASANQKLPNRLNQVAQPSPEAVVIIKSWPVGESEATKAKIVLNPPTFAERNRLGAPKPVFTLKPAKPATADPAVDYKKATNTKGKGRVRSRQPSSASWKNKVWGVPD